VDLPWSMWAIIEKLRILFMDNGVAHSQSLRKA
jgi:hypothetical protein